MTARFPRPFVVRPWKGPLPWAVFERIAVEAPGRTSFEERLTSTWSTRESAREAARQLNEEEP